MSETIAAVDAMQSATVQIDPTTGLASYNILPIPGPGLAYRIWHLTVTTANMTGAGVYFMDFGVLIGANANIAYNLPAAASPGADFFEFSWEPRGALCPENLGYDLFPSFPAPATGLITASLAFELEQL